MNTLTPQYYISHVITRLFQIQVYGDYLVRTRLSEHRPLASGVHE